MSRICFTSHQIETIRVGIRKVEPLLVAFNSQLKVFHSPFDDNAPEKARIKDLFGGEVSTMMSPRGSIVASFENVESFFVVHTPPDHLIRVDFKQKGVVPEVVFHVFKKLVFLLGRHSLNNKVARVVICKVCKPRDPLGKFQGKVDEGFLVGYSVCSKAFRVFNSKTRIVQETLHVNFMKNKPTVVGSGPAWLFDIDSLTQTMNYHLVLIENQTNSNAGFQDTEDALVDGKDHDDDIQKSVSPDIHSSSCGDQTRKQGDKNENKDKGKSPVVTITGFRDLNEKFEECINNSSNEVNAADSLVSAAGLNFTNS
nr:retrovirus-related Pol polyprotein from transposon TNT 1-94 [Tanacetum cinerariifolium]